MAQDPEVLQVTREELKGFGDKIVVDLKSQMDGEIEKKLDAGFEKFRKSYKSDTEKVSPDEAMGKQLAALRFPNGKIAKEIKESPVFKTLAPQNETTAADGGTLVPDITRPEILRLMEEFGVGRSDFRVLPMGQAKVINIPRKLTGATVTRTTENTAIADTKATLDYITLTASKVAAIVAMSSELDEDSIVDMGSYVNELLAESFAEEEDGQYYAGTGSPFTGLFNTTSTYGKEIEVTSAADITYDNLVDMVFGIKQNYLSGAVLRMHRTAYAVIAKIKDNEDRPLFVNPGDVARNTLFGYPIKLVEKAPASDTTTAGMPLMVLGAGRHAIIGQKRELNMKVLTEATVDSVNLAENDLVGIRVTKRDAFAIAQPSAYSVIKINE